jgi:5'-3' exonuclease
MVGNDFLPQMSLFNIYDGGLDLMMKNYFTTPGYITFKSYQRTKKCMKKKDDFKIKINFKNLVGVFEHMLNNINPHAIQHYQTREYGYPNILLDVASKKELSFIDITLHYLKSYTIHHKINKKLIGAYLDEIKWVFNYYVYGGATVDWNMYYPSQFAPTSLDLLNYLKTTYKSTNSDGEKELLSSFQIDPFFQLLCILPPHSSDLLPEPLNKVLTNDMVHFHPKEVTIDYNGKLNEWEGVPLLPALNYEEILSIYRTNVKSCLKKDLKRNTNSKQLMMSVNT